MMQNIDNKQDASKHLLDRLSVGDVSCRFFMVFNPIGEDWEQMSIAFKTFEEAKAYYDRQDRKKYPYLRILAELSYNGS